LSFLGLGAQPPQADLGSMLGNGRAVMFIAPHVCIVPGLMIFAIVMSINLLGDGVRDMLDPRLRAGEPGRPRAVTRVQRRDPPPATSGGDHALEVRGLETAFATPNGLVPAVRSVSFTLDRGECLGLI